MQKAPFRCCRLVLTMLALLLLLAMNAGAADQHAFSLDDYSGLRSARAAAVSPDGKSILYQVAYDGVKGPTKSEWWMIGVSGANPHKLSLPKTFRPHGFTPGGALYGRYQVDKMGQLAIVPLAKNQPIRTIDLPSGVRSATISPDGSRFALLADPRPKDPLSRVHSVVRSGQTSLYVVGLTGDKGKWWCPELKHITDIAWSGDGAQVAVVTQNPKIGHHELHSVIYVCGASGARRIAEIPNATSGIAWAGSQELVFASTTTPVLTPDHIWSVSLKGGVPVDRTPKLDASAVNVASDAHGSVWVMLHRGVVTEIAAYHNGKLETAYRWPAGVINGFPASTMLAASPDVHAFSVSDPTHSTNVAAEHDGKLVRITHEGDDVLSSVELGDVRVIHWTSREGIKLEGIATFPADYSAAKKWPFLVLPHGGPESNDQLAFSIFARMIAGLGYVVIQPEYRGSTGYGSDFLGAIYQHFGDRAYQDVDSATDYAIAQGWADPKRLAMFGWSAGGFMTSWTVTQTHRYRAAIEGAGITDWLSFVPTSDTWQTDYDARLEEKDPTPLLQFSAVMHADQVTTPLLILHGQSDVRVPMLQGLEYFVLLKERGKTVRMVTYPGSPHFPRLAEQRRDVFKEIANWLEKYNP